MAFSVAWTSLVLSVAIITTFEIESLDYPRIQKSEFSYDVNSTILSWDPMLKTELKSTEENEEIVLKYNRNVEFGSNANLQIKYKPIKGNSLEKTLKLGSADKIKLIGFGQYCFKGVLDLPMEHYTDSENYCLNFVQLPVFPFIPKAKDSVLSYVKHNGLDSYKLEVPNINKAVKYYIEICSDSAGKKIVYTASSGTPVFFWTANHSGLFFLKYRVYDSKDRESDFSPLSKLIFPISPLSDW